VSGERITRDELRDRLITGKPPTFVAELISEDAATPPLIVGTVELAMDDDHGDVGSSSTDANDPPLPPHAILGLLAVDPAHQSRRIGSTLVKAAEAYARDTLQLQALVIWVINRRSEIINWYQRLGFKDTGRTIPFVWEDKLIDKNVYFRIFIKNLVD
jgi:GNAT superfamily N-acetyltransferase